MGGGARKREDERSICKVKTQTSENTYRGQKADVARGSSNLTRKTMLSWKTSSFKNSTGLPPFLLALHSLVSVSQCLQRPRWLPFGAVFQGCLIDTDSALQGAEWLWQHKQDEITLRYQCCECLMKQTKNQTWRSDCYLKIIVCVHVHVPVFVRLLSIPQPLVPSSLRICTGKWLSEIYPL